MKTYTVMLQVKLTERKFRNKVTMTSTEVLAKEHKRKYVNIKINRKPVGFQVCIMTIRSINPLSRPNLSPV